MTYNIYKQFLHCWVLLFGVMGGFASQAIGQANIKVRVVSVATVNNVDCDGFGVCESDFQWEFQATDNTIGRSNNNPSSLLGLPTGLLGSVYNYLMIDNNNGAYTYNVGSASIANGCLLNPGRTVVDPATGLFFDQDYVCPGDVPSAITIRWVAYDDDPVGEQGACAIQSISVATPTGTGTTPVQTFTAVSTDGGCPQTYRISFTIQRTNLSVTPIPDDICNAAQVPVNGVRQRFVWCPDATLEVGEPNRSEVSQNKSRWFYFVAPASGTVTISTDFSTTDFDTYFEVYHAADGAGCATGLTPFGTRVKNKFDYLSYIDYADVAFLSGKADITFDACNPIPGGNSHSLVAGEVYYIQMTTDDPNQRGYLDIQIDNENGTTAALYDIPCRSNTATVGTTVRTFANGLPASSSMPFGCATGRETGDPYTGIDPTQFQAYDYNHSATNNGSINESVWFNFVAPHSGRIYFEGNVLGALSVNETENTALFGFDSRFTPNVPAGYSCANLSVLNAMEGGTSLGATPTAIIRQSCLEPGYTYYGMVDPASAATGSDARAWIYDPSATDTINNAPGNDILCLSLGDTLYEVPVVPVDSTIPFAAVAGTNIRACREYLAGEPASNSNPALRADQTVWHYFTVPASGVVDIKLRAYIGMHRLNYAIYPLLNGTDCYGGLRPATFTQNGTSLSPAITPIASGSTGFGGTTVSLCCLVPGTKFAIQIDGGAPGDQGQYIIEYIREIEVYAGDSRYLTENHDTIDYNSNDTAFICFGDSIYPRTMPNGLGVSTVSIPLCLDTGFVLHRAMPLPTNLVGSGFTYVDSVRFGTMAFVNDGNGSGSFGNPLYNTVYYVSSLADEASSWGRITCSSASIENGAPVVFLQPITTTQSYNSTVCSFTFTVTGGLPAYNGSTFSYAIVDALGDTLQRGTVANNSPLTYSVPAAGIYTVLVRDGATCTHVITINATPCQNPCINNPVRILPSPINSSVYACQPNGSASVTLQLNGGDPIINGTVYNVTITGSSIAGQNGVRTQAPVGGATPTPFTFIVDDNDAWQIIVEDANGCRDTAGGTFVYNGTNCPSMCAQNPVVATSTYDCFSNRTALVEVTIGGGVPSWNGSNYFVSVSGSTIAGQTFSNAQIPGQVGGTTRISFMVNDGDAWRVIVHDSVPCADTLADTYHYGTSDCPNLCALNPVHIIPDPITNSVYTCHGDGTATVTLNLLGGDPAVNGTNYTIVVSGSTVAGANGSHTASTGQFTFNVADGDTWSAVVSDVNTCADTATGTFIFNLATCPTICSFLNLQVSNAQYACNPDGTALVTVTLAGGKAAYDGSNYFVTVTGSTAGGNVSNATVAGVLNGTTIYQFLVRNGDAWAVHVEDVETCEDDLQGVFVWNPANCGNICGHPSYTPIVLNNGNGFTYNCDSMGYATVTFNVTGGLPQFSPNSGGYTVIATANGATTTYLVDASGSFTISVSNGSTWAVRVFDAAGCDTAVVAPTVFSRVEAVATTDASSELLIGQFAMLNGAASRGNNLTYQWLPTDRVTNPTAAITQVQPIYTRDYILRVTDNLGCSDVDTVEVPVGACIPLHAGFTPNNDGTNDTWIVPCLAMFDNNVEVYNRWGQLVYARENYDGSWDGKNNGQDLAAATYYYVITVKYPHLDKPVPYKGTVTILR